MRNLVGHAERVTGCAMTPDGRRVVSAGWSAARLDDALEYPRDPEPVHVPELCTRHRLTAFIPCLRCSTAAETGKLVCIGGWR